MRESGEYKNARIWLKTHNLIERRASQLNITQTEFFNQVLTEYFEKDFKAPELPVEDLPSSNKFTHTTNTSKESPIAVQVTIDYDLHCEFKAIAEGLGYYARQGKPRGKTAIKYLRNDIVVAALKKWVEEHK